MSAGNGKQIVSTPGLYDSRPRGYVQCITAGDLIFVAGQVGVDAQGQVVSSEFAAQAEQALTNVRVALEAAGATPADVTAVTYYLTDMGNLPRLGPIRQRVLPGLEATSTALQISALARPELLIEVTVMAVRGAG
ncbi:MAG TPA: RidA family protein [Thermomicrobiaceae bacterium]|nr:RidA family protein [Thermomicrobiaceae bacterium]